MADADEQQQRASHGDQVPPPPPPAAAAARSTSSSSHEVHADDEEKAAVPTAQAPPATTTEHDANASDAQPAATSAPLVTVNLKFIHRERLSVQCARDILVSELKKRVLELYARHVESENSGAAGVTAQSTTSTESDMATGASLRLIYKGKVLKDDQVLATFNFVDEDTIHAVFGRPQTAATSANATTNTAASSAGPTATSSTTATRNSTGGVTTTTNGVSDLGDGIVLGQFNLGGGENSGFAEIGSFLNTILSSFAGAAGPEGATASILQRATSDPPLSSVSGTSTVTTATTSAASTALSAATTPSSASTTASAPASSTADASSASTPAVSTSTAPASSAPAAPTSVTTIRYSIPLGPPRQAPPPPSASVTGNATSLLNQAASLRRMIPALELSPLSQPPELTDEMYALGNAMREAGDTFLAVHRQLQFIATRFLSENNLNASERLRLRTRVHQLVSILDQVGALSRAVSGNLATSSYGPLASPAQTSQTATQPPVTTRQTSQPAAQQPAPPVSATPTTRLTAASVSVSPTVNIFGGGDANAPGPNAPSVGNSIGEILQAVSGLTGGATTTMTDSTNQQSSAPSSLGSLLNLVSALTSNGSRPGQSMASSNGSSAQWATVPVNQNQPASASPGSVLSPPADSSSQVIAASIPSQPLSALFTQVMRDMDTLDEWDPDTAEDLLKRLYPHLRHRIRSLFGSASNATEQSLRKKWCENAAEEIESAMRQVFESHAQPYTRDQLRCRINGVTLDHLLEILLDANTSDFQDQEHISASLEKLRKLFRKFCTSVHLDMSEQTNPIEAVRITSNAISSILTTEDLSVRRSAETLASRVNREVTSLLKHRTA
ncbi:hypothetical protein Gpo141_00000419 [Globisporangium polare]